MLYDPKWEKQAEQKVDPFLLASLIAWLETKEPLARYNYTCNGHCLLAQYFAAMGFKNVTMWTDCFYHHNDPIKLMNQDEARLLGITTPLPAHFNEIARGLDWSYRMTFGAALERARSFAVSN